MSLRDLIPERTDRSDPRDLRLRPQRIQTCVLDLGALDPEVAREALREAVERELLESFSIHPKRGTSGHFVSIAAETRTLLRLNQRFRLGEMRRWHGAIQTNWPDWAKTDDGKPLNRWLGLD